VTAAALPTSFWITGLSASGKSTLSSAFYTTLQAEQPGRFVLLDGEAVRAALPREYGYSPQERAEVVRHVVALADRHRHAGRHPIIAAIAFQAESRRYARQHLSPFYEVFLDCPPDVCAARDIKGHWAAAKAGDHDCFVGVTHDYERAGTADLVINTAKQTPAQCLEQLLSATRPLLQA